ncbi:secreted protein [Humitalea rosea]|uniref:Secreted protein n=1 Tax=Humitalea rosea TaxID=990373 RepID=A0A2W7I5V0_9PROT|nr:twin-arginine translocation signal domain-containing protein [Humitalea rosea]PZW42251.1 secreted protein [Humitalea rosea]
MADDTTSERRGFLKTLGIGAAAAASTAAAAQAANLPGYDRADAVSAGVPVAKENRDDRLKARYRETEHVATYYRTNRY